MAPWNGPNEVVARRQLCCDTCGVSLRARRAVPCRPRAAPDAIARRFMFLLTEKPGLRSAPWHGRRLLMTCMTHDFDLGLSIVPEPRYQRSSVVSYRKKVRVKLR